ncbi:MAG: F0F1 ATP synthase subunit delta [Candidatus Omnitrophica bacterium]|nr:F0F1 ATP synthase subunit delta [Candidatus Omnitrophota bacterium]
MEILIPMIILQVVTFAALVFVLRKLMYSASAEEAKRLKQMEEEYLRRTQDLSAKMESVDKEYRAKVTIAEEEARRLREEAKVEAEKIKEESLSKAHDESERIVNQAVNTRSKIKQEIEAQAQSKVLDASRKLVAKVLSSKQLKRMHEDLVEELIGELEKADGRKLAEAAEKGEVSVPYEMGREWVEKIAAAVSKKAGKKVSLTEKADKGVVAGAVIKLGSIIIDGSIIGRLKDAYTD